MPRRTRRQRAVAALMVAALVLYGLTATLVASLGHSHWHIGHVGHVASATLDAGTPVLVDFRRTDHFAVSPGRAAAHSHALLERHHHDAVDPTAVAIDAAASGDSLAGDGGASALAPLVLIASASNGLDVPEPGERALRRPASTEARLANGHSRLPERPPKA